MATRADIYVVADASARLRKQRAEFDRRGCRTAAFQDSGQKRTTQILTWKAGDQRQELRRSLKRAVAADDRRASKEGQQLWSHQQRGHRPPDRLDERFHARAVTAPAAGR